MDRGTLLVRLRELQALPKFQKRDICSISSFLSLDALAEHVKVCEEAAGVTPIAQN